LHCGAHASVSIVSCIKHLGVGFIKKAANIEDRERQQNHNHFYPLCLQEPLRRRLPCPHIPEELERHTHLTALQHHPTKETDLLYISAKRWNNIQVSSARI
jgi:hypothetical protein